MRTTTLWIALTLLPSCKETVLALEDGRESQGPQIISGPTSSFVGPAAMSADTRPAVSDATPPPPISGGTLFVTREGLVVVADEARGTIHGVDGATASVAWRLDVGIESRPGRVVESEGAIHVALRGLGQVLSLDSDGMEIGRTSVCAEPAGLAYSARQDLLLVACRDGSLVGVDPSSAAATPLHRGTRDLRDIVVISDPADPSKEQIWASWFRSAQLCRLDAVWTFTDCYTPSTSALNDTSDDRESGAEDVSLVMEAAVGWRMVATSEGPLLLHQRGRRDAIALSSPTGASGGYGTVNASDNACSTIAGPAATVVNTSGAVLSSNQLAPALFVDVAVSGDGTVAFANAGPQDPGAPDAFAADSSAAVRIFPSLEELLSLTSDTRQSGCTDRTEEILVPGFVQAVSVAFSRAEPSRLFVQLLQPARLLVVDDGTRAVLHTIELDGESVVDTGHQLFHQVTDSGLACAMCHPQGREDGRVWSFEPQGSRRTQSLEGGLAHTEPLHWNGELSDMNELLNEILVLRMGGFPQSGERIHALASWVFSIPPPKPIRAADDELSLRGATLFASAEVGCSSCHQAGVNDNYDVGTGEPLQVPPLRGVAYRAPYLHDGCATTLEDRFGPCGGGDAHGKTSNLSEADIGALIAFMETL